MILIFWVSGRDLRHNYYLAETAVYLTVEKLLPGLLRSGTNCATTNQGSSPRDLGLECTRDDFYVVLVFRGKVLVLVLILMFSVTRDHFCDLGLGLERQGLGLDN